MTDPKPHELNSDSDELFELAAGTYSCDYLRWYVKEHGGVPPEIEATTVDVTDRLLGTATVGLRIERLRNAAGMSQNDLAAAVGRSASWVSQIERGALPVDRLPVLQALADALNVDITCRLQPNTAMQVRFEDEA